MRRKDPPRSASTPSANDMLLVRTLRGARLAKVWQVQDDAAIHVHWWNGLHGRLQPSARVHPAYLDGPAKPREVFTMSPTKDQALQPVWGITACRQAIGQPFTLQEKKPDHLFFPTSARTAIADCRLPIGSVPIQRNCPRKSAQECMLLYLTPPRPALLCLELDGNRATKAKEGAVEVPAPLELRS
jgi:hypothetical protein